MKRKGWYRTRRIGVSCKKEAGKWDGRKNDGEGEGGFGGRRSLLGREVLCRDGWVTFKVG